ncbi:MAG: hypothetical protein HOY75_45970 [Streptomyces sp.]|nr:hypothetical protein [Streptomyces sp.]
MWNQQRLVFKQPQCRLHRHAHAADHMPLDFVVFDVLHMTGAVTTGWPGHRAFSTVPVDDQP